MVWEGQLVFMNMKTRDYDLRFNIDVWPWAAALQIRTSCVKMGINISLQMSSLFQCYQAMLTNPSTVNVLFGWMPEQYTVSFHTEGSS